jgi:hypothetical protein
VEDLYVTDGPSIAVDLEIPGRKHPVEDLYSALRAAS